MKTIQSSSRGRGAVHSRGGRGRGRGDARFAARFTDPRFQVSRRGGRGGNNYNKYNKYDNPRDAALRDPRFAKHLHKIDGGSEEFDDEEEDEDEEDDDISHSGSSSGSHSDDNQEIMNVVDGEVEDLEEEAAAWSASDVEFVEPRRRVAIVNCSWDHIRAVDLYAILFYALPLGGQLVDVSVYMSDFGKRMLEHERVQGPDLWDKKEKAEDERDTSKISEKETADKPTDEDDLRLRKNNNNNKNKNNNNDDDDDDDDNNNNNNNNNNNDDDDAWQDDNIAMLEEEGEDGEFFSQGKYRKYERDRMKYYYAIATFDSAETAETVYKQLDGMDVEASGVVLDLRYVDDDESFENPVSRADRIPANYKPLAAFKAAALSQTRFRISWDQDDVFRHRSIRDSFTGETADDDLAAYIAPPDSSDEDEVDDGGKGNNANDKEKRIREKMRIRKKYAALLEEIGGLPQDYEPSDEGENNNDNKFGDDEEDEDEDDDSLNRFSDVEMESEEEEDEDEDHHSDGEVMGDMEATLDLDAETKAARLQRETHIKQMMKSSDLGTKAELKYKLRRKEMRKAKKEMLEQEREAEAAQLQADREKRRQALREALGTDDMGATHVSGKEKRKLHAKAVKQRAAAEREAKKKMRASNALGVTREVREARQQEAAKAAADAIDPRFQSKLLADPRFHLDVAQKDKRSKAELVELAATVATARQSKRQQEGKKTNTDDAMEYFLNRPGKKAKKENQ
ncbi:uncharacterized protein TM35_000341610 [Trypanosoma theileri]|uniref:ESF1 RRM domain-containing protein n=1 Tax=Trypanosoma theileri TaxID=67003 RepID=A0A1X0NN45_9TRYP|nr:uncharacterized protein TM35_000341610 [Trypanosoma theileri]ORC85549.1 hypothetical protein TM35_000341610 [Trypanosoma theileri]